MAFLIGITGRAGSGKSTISAMLKSIDAEILDLDSYAAGLYSDQNVIEQIESTFGHSDKEKLREQCFSDKDSLDKLNGIFYHRFKSAVSDFRKKLTVEGVEIGVVDGAVLVDAGLNQQVDCVIFAEAPEEVMAERFSGRKGIDYDQAMQVIKAQEKLLYSRDKSDLIVETSPQPEEIKKKLWTSLSSIVPDKLKKAFIAGIIFFVTAISAITPGCGEKKPEEPPPVVVDNAIVMYNYVKEGALPDTGGPVIAEDLQNEDFEALQEMDADHRAEVLMKKLFPQKAPEDTLVGRNAEMPEINRASKLLESDRAYDALRVAEEMIAHNPRDPEVVMRAEFMRAMAFTKLENRRGYEEAMGKSIEAMAMMAAKSEVIKFREQRLQLQQNIEALVPWEENIAPDGISGDDSGE